MPISERVIQEIAERLGKHKVCVLPCENKREMREFHDAIGLVGNQLKALDVKFDSISTAETEVLNEWKYVAFLGNFADAKDAAQDQATWVLADDEP